MAQEGRYQDGATEGIEARRFRATADSDDKLVIFPSINKISVIFFLYGRAELRHYSHAIGAHQAKEGIDYLHGILRDREDTLIILRDESNALMLKPFHNIFVAECAQGSLHQFIATRICHLEVGNVAERVGEIATPTASDSHLCQWCLASFIDVNLNIFRMMQMEQKLPTAPAPMIATLVISNYLLLIFHYYLQPLQ